MSFVVLPTPIQQAIAKHGAFFVESIIKAIRQHVSECDASDQECDQVSRVTIESAVGSIAMSFMGVIIVGDKDPASLDKKELIALTTSFLSQVSRGLEKADWRICN